MTVQFQDNVEHTVVLKDIRPQKVCVSYKQLKYVLFSCRNQISSLNGPSCNKKLKNVRAGTKIWREN